MRPPKFIHKPCKHTITLNSDDFVHSDCFNEHTISDFTQSGRFISRNSLTKPVCSRLRITVCLLATRELEHKPHDLCPPTKHCCSFHFRPNSQLTGWTFTNWFMYASWRTRFSQIKNDKLRTCRDARPCVSKSP